ncbi:ABC transporter ATP-binding protein [Ectopseudomonas mendocina]|uniref:ABC transporter ATP-binding protein n=1 Tax=Ectopseudomonas mendocina TaxID=300 RepID=UPI00376EA8E1
MFQIFSKLYALLNREERKRAKLVFLLMLGTAFLEMLGVASIMPFVGVLATPGIVESNEYLAAANQWLGFEEPRMFLIFLGSIVLLLFVFSLAFKALSAYVVLRFSNMRSHAFSYRLLCGYLSRPYSFFLQCNTSDLNKTLFSEVSEVVNGGLVPSLRVVSGLIVSMMIVLLLLTIEPMLTLVVGFVLGGGFSLVYFLSRRYLQRIGLLRVATNQQRFVLANESLNGIKELRLMGREYNYIKRFHDVSERFANYQSISKAMGDIPNYAIQAIAFGGVLVLILYLMGRYGGLEGALPLIALYAFAGYRLLPAFQDIFKNVTQLRFYGAAIDVLHSELASVPNVDLMNFQDVGVGRLSGDLILEKVCFQYVGATSPALYNLSINIPYGSSAAFVGTTGAGKSTVVDLILGLLEPSSGSIRVGDQFLQGNSLKAWQRNIGYVPQTIYLADASVAENIAFGVPKADIDMQAVERAARAAHIHDFIVEQLPEGYRTHTGERGVRLSGGQRQRIGIARALYHNPEVVVFDEATSALDNATEAAVMQAVNELRGEKTIILIAHRLSTVERCDTIFMLEHGRLCASGTYQELMADSDAFSRLASTNS